MIIEYKKLVESLEKPELNDIEQDLIKELCDLTNIEIED